MVAYSFQGRFAEPILAGTKGGTIRMPRRNLRRPGGHARPGESLQLYTAMRTRHCRLITEKVCKATLPIRLIFGAQPAVVIEGLRYATSRALHAFAIFDGFEDWMALMDFWYLTHQETQWFEGYHIRWLDLPPELFR